MKATIVALLAAASLSAASYDIADILTASTAADTRAKDWKPGDGLALEVSGMDWTADGKLALVQVSSDRNPGDFYLFNVDARRRWASDRFRSPGGRTEAEQVKLTPTGDEPIPRAR